MQEKELINISESLLNNADFEIDFESFPLAIIFTFYVAGTNKKVKIKCNQIKRLGIEKDISEEAFFTTLDTKVQRDEVESLWRVRIDGPDIFVDVKFKDVDWALSLMTKEDLAMFQ